MTTIAAAAKPAGARWILQGAMRRARALKADAQLSGVKHRVWARRPGSVLRCAGYTVRINDGPNFYMLYKDLFVRRLYHFEVRRPDPRILDCGSNIGMSILYFKRAYPQARIVGFEPDPDIFAVLEENVQRNRLSGVQLICAAVAGEEGTACFRADGKYEGTLAALHADPLPGGWWEMEVPVVRLRAYLEEPTDLLKMNIEGAEWSVIADVADRLRMVRHVMIEYHHLPGLPRTLHQILSVLHEQGFDYLIHDFDEATNPQVRPPFHLSDESRYFLLIYAHRRE